MNRTLSTWSKTCNYMDASSITSRIRAYTRARKFYQVIMTCNKWGACQRSVSKYMPSTAIRLTFYTVRRRGLIASDLKYSVIGFVVKFISRCHPQSADCWWLLSAHSTIVVDFKLSLHNINQIQKYYAHKNFRYHKMHAHFVHRKCCFSPRKSC